MSEASIGAKLSLFHFVTYILTVKMMYCLIHCTVEKNNFKVPVYPIVLIKKEKTKRSSFVT